MDGWICSSETGSVYDNTADEWVPAKEGWRLTATGELYDSNGDLDSRIN
jgi:frataxin-like iron-binding protein CyaY